MTTDEIKAIIEHLHGIESALGWIAVWLFLRLLESNYKK